jgi:hypothetical protein
MLSAHSLAFTSCNKPSVISIDNLRCSQVEIASLLWLITGVVSVYFFVLAMMNIRKIPKA